MDQSAPRSLKHEYNEYVENEIELYKESISRTTLLKIGDEAVAALQAQQQLAMNELLLCDEVDRIIRKRLGTLSYATWRKKKLRQLRELEEFRRPERWGVSADSVLAREVHLPAEARVLVAGTSIVNTARYLAAQGCSVMALDGATPDSEPTLNAQDEAMLAGRIDTIPVALREWSPAEPLNAVVCTPAAFAGLSAKERQRVLAVLQSATQDGGVHLVNTIVASQPGPSLAELRKSYKGWSISVVDEGNHSRSFLARKDVA